MTRASESPYRQMAKHRHRSKGAETLMALTRKFLIALGIEAEKIDQIIEGHSEAVEALKAQRDEAEAKAEELRGEASKVPSLEKQIEDMRAAMQDDDWETKYNEARAEADKAAADLERLNGEYDAYKRKVEADAADAEKLDLYKRLLREIGLDEKRVDKAARLKALDELTVEDGALAGYEELKAAEAEEWADFIPRVSGPKGQAVPTPPKSEPTEGGADPAIKKMLEERHADLYGKSE